MNTTTIAIPHCTALPQAAAQFIRAVGPGAVVAFYGGMGAGKTTFISEVCRQLGVDDDEVSSPSFALVNEYRSLTTGRAIYHFDLMRLKSQAEALDMGFEDYIDSGAMCLIEWPETVEHLLPAGAVRATLAVDAAGGRTLRLEPMA